MKHQIKKLENGLTVLFVPNNSVESVVVDIFVRTGSRSETPVENGISHFLEHFLFKGTKQYPSAMAISSLVDSLGGEMNANTGKEHTQYFIKTEKQHVHLLLEILSNMFQEPLLDAVELEREKGVIVEEINMYKDMPMVEVENVLESSMWPEDALGMSIAGEKGTVTKFSREMFLDYMQRHYQPKNMIIAVAGKFDEAKVYQQIKKLWSNTPDKKFHKPEKALDVQNTSRVAVEYKKSDQAHLVLGFKGFKHTDKRNTTARVLASILGGGMSSRLFYQVRERRGLAYYVRAGNGNYLDAGVFQMSAGVQTHKINEAIAVMLSEAKKLKTELVSAEELAKAKNYISGRTALALEDLQNQMDWYLDQVAFEKSIKTPEVVLQEIAKVTPQQIRKLAKELFTSKKLTLAIIGPYKNKKQFEKLLKV